MTREAEKTVPIADHFALEKAFGEARVTAVDALLDLCAVRELIDTRIKALQTELGLVAFKSTHGWRTRDPEEN